MPTLSDLQDARERITPHIRTTPVTYDARLGAWLKWESQQVTGSFKPRGGFNKILSLTAEERARGLIACSAGNHGQGAALAARTTGASLTVYVAAHAARNKIEKMRALGAEVIQIEGEYIEAESQAIQAARDQGKVWVSPYNDPLVMAGQGTVALELAEQCPETKRWLVPVGGGGLIAGVMAGAPEGVSVIGVQGEASPYLHHEFHYHDMSQAVDLPSLADGLSGGIEAGSATIAAIHGAADMRLVSESQIAEAVAYVYHTHGQVIEGSGAVGVALLLSGQLQPDGATAIIVSGGNIDADKHQNVISNYH